MPTRFTPTALCAAALACLAACGTTPSTPVYPVYKGEPTPQASHYIIPAERDGRANSDPPLPLEQTITDVYDQVDAHLRTWQLEESSLSQTIDGLGNTQFAGMVLAGMGAIATSLDVAAGGTAIAGAASLWNDHYKFQVQRENYKLAGVAMACVRRELKMLPSSFWRVTYDDTSQAAGHMFLSREQVTWDALPANTSATERDAAYDALADIFKTIHLAVDQIRTRLATKQRSLAIAAPKADEIKAALGAQAAAEGTATKGAESLRMSAAGAAPQRFAALAPANAAVKRAFSIAGEVANTDQAKVDHAQQFAELGAETIKRAIQLPKALDACVASIG